MTQSPVLSRFSVIEKPIASPGKCVVCGAVNRPVIDFNFNIDWYGAVYFCTICMREAASKLGFISLEKYIGLEQEASRIIANYCTTNNLALVDRDSYERFRDLVNSITNSIPVRVSPIMGTEKRDTPFDFFNEGVESDNGKSTGKISGITGNQRPASISSSSDDGFSFTV